jgi:diguanylate cyclase (GGDEF)-like protein
VLGFLTVTVTFWLTHEVSDAHRARQDAELVREGLIVARDRISSGDSAYWKRRATGEALVTPSTPLVLEFATSAFAHLAGLSREGGRPDAIAAANRAVASLAALRDSARSAPALPRGTPAELAAVKLGERRLAQLNRATEDWLAAETRRAAAAAARQSSLTGRLPMAVASTTGAIVLVALLGSLAIERSRRRALDGLVGATEDFEGMAVTDPLTGLANRRAFDSTMLVELARVDRGDQPMSLVVLDVDEFKAVNDRLGHEGGDAVLVEVARRLQGLARAQDLIARVGGEEFAWILPATDADAALRAAERARQTIASSPIEGAAVTISAGAAQLEADGIRIIARADAALYAAKQRGRDRAVLA